MFESFFQAIEGFAVHHGALGVFIASTIEEALSVPSSIVIASASFIMLSGKAVALDSIGRLFFGVVIPASLGLTLGSLVVYFIFYIIGEPAVERFGKYVGVSWKSIEDLKNKRGNATRDNLFLFIARTLPPVPFSLINAFCGLVRWNFFSYLVITFAGAIVRSTIVAVISWQLGSIYKKHLTYFDFAEKALVIIFIVALLLWIFYRRKYGNAKMKEINKNDKI